MQLHITCNWRASGGQCQQKCSIVLNSSFSIMVTTLFRESLCQSLFYCILFQSAPNVVYTQFNIQQRISLGMLASAIFLVNQTYFVVSINTSTGDVPHDVDTQTKWLFHQESLIGMVFALELQAGCSSRNWKQPHEEPLCSLPQFSCNICRSPQIKNTVSQQRSTDIRDTPGLICVLTYDCYFTPACVSFGGWVTDDGRDEAKRRK